MLRTVNVLSFLLFNNIKNNISDIRDIKHQIIACPWNLGYQSFKVTENGTIR